MQTQYEYEFTDTFGGEANYSWVHQGDVEAKSDLAAVRKIKAELGLSGVDCKREDYGDMIELRPYGTCTVLFITYKY